MAKLELSSNQLLRSRTTAAPRRRGLLHSARSLTLLALSLMSPLRLLHRQWRGGPGLRRHRTQLAGGGNRVTMVGKAMAGTLGQAHRGKRHFRTHQLRLPTRRASKRRSEVPLRPSRISEGAPRKTLCTAAAAGHHCIPQRVCPDTAKDCVPRIMGCSARERANWSNYAGHAIRNTAMTMSQSEVFDLGYRAHANATEPAQEVYWRYRGLQLTR